MMPLSHWFLLGHDLRHRRRACGSGISAFLLGIAVALKHLLGKKTAVPNPLTVEHFKKKADHDDLQDLEKEMRAIVERERDTHRNSLRDLHHRIDQVAIAASRTDAQLAEVKKNTDLILAKLL
jgi:glucose-6-phosphate-specific signal transduction histidine kinase